VENVLSQNVQTIHLETTSFGDSDIKHKIRTILQEYEFFNQGEEGLRQEP